MGLFDFLFGGKKRTNVEVISGWFPGQGRTGGGKSGEGKSRADVFSSRSFIRGKPLEVRARKRLIGLSAALGQAELAVKRAAEQPDENAVNYSLELVSNWQASRREFAAALKTSKLITDPVVRAAVLLKRVAAATRSGSMSAEQEDANVFRHGVEFARENFSDRVGGNGAAADPCPHDPA